MNKYNEKSNFYGEVELVSRKKTLIKVEGQLLTAKFKDFVFKVDELIVEDGHKLVDRTLNFRNFIDEPSIQLNTFFKDNNNFLTLPTPTLIQHGNPLEAILKTGLKLDVINGYEPDDESGKPLNFKSSFLDIENGNQLFEISLMIGDSFESIYYNDQVPELKSRFKINQELIKKLSNYSPIKNLKYNLEIARNYKNDTTLDNLFLEFYVNNNWLKWEQLSDGTKRIFYLITSVFYSNKSVLLEEPELGIHPDQLYKLMDFIKEQSKKKQIIITTHSPEVLSILNKDEIDRIIVTRYDAEKGTQMHHLSAEKTRKAQIYIEETGDLSSFWVHSNLEEYDAEETEN